MAIVINNAEVKVGDIWELRDGGLITISEVKEGYTWCIKSRDTITSWDKNGLASINGHESFDDLVKLIKRAEDTIVEDTIVEDTIVEDTIVEDTIVEDTIVEDTIVEDAIVEDTIVEDTIVEDTIVEDSTYTPKEQGISKQRFEYGIDALSYEVTPLIATTKEQFKKFDTNKPRYSLIDPDWQEDVAKVLTMGARKYEANNWKLCEDPERYIDALIRHLEDIRRGKFKDKESKLQHTAHISCNAMFLHWMIKNGVLK